MTKKMSKEVKKYFKNEIIKYIKIKNERKKIINQAYFEKKEYEKIKKIH